MELVPKTDVLETMDDLRGAVARLERDLAAARYEKNVAVSHLQKSGKEKNLAYSERNCLVAALSKLYPSGLGIDGNFEQSNPEWMNLVFVDLPAGQASWHVHASEMPMFAHLRPYMKRYDGHTIAEKYARLAAISSSRIILP